MVWILQRVLHSLADRIGLVDRPDQRRKRHAVPVPVVGGIAIYGGILAGALWWFPLSSHALFLLIGAGVLVVVGAMDDRFHLGVGLRFAAQSISALLLIFGADVRLDSLGDRRMRRGRSPFAADRRHLHHDLLRAFGCSKNTLRVTLSGAVLMAAIAVSATARFIPEATLFYAFFLIVCLYFASHWIMPRVLRWSYRKRRNTRSLGHVALSESEAA